MDDRNVGLERLAAMSSLNKDFEAGHDDNAWNPRIHNPTLFSSKETGDLSF
jgi:hypothetical protein